MIKINSLSKSFQTKSGTVEALDKVNLEIADGQIFGIIGLSGAGKSTLIRCINMLERPSSGTIEMDGVDLGALSDNELRAARKKIGMIFQHFNLLKSRTTLGNVLFPLEVAGVPKDEAKAKAISMLELVGLSERMNSYPSQLSGGQKQRVGIARALANNPSVLLSDEATSALDPQTTRSILDLLNEINRRLGVTIILITHEMNVIKEICDYVAVMEQGTIVEQGPVKEVFTHPQQSTTKEFVHHAFNLDPTASLEGLPQTHGPNDEGKESKILRLTFLGDTAYESLISRMVRLYDVDLSILQGNIDRFRDMPFGNLVVELAGTKESLDNSINWLSENRLAVEVLA